MRAWVYIYVCPSGSAAKKYRYTKIETNRSCINSTAAFYIYFLLDYIRIFVGNEENCGEIITYYDYYIAVTDS